MIPSLISLQIFSTGTELEKRHEMAAFIGHTLHESGNYQFPRETSQCGDITVDGSDTVFCTTPTGTYSDYCSSSHTSGGTPETSSYGCDCADVDTPYEANKMFFGRG